MYFIYVTWEPTSCFQIIRTLTVMGGLGARGWLCCPLIVDDPSFWKIHQDKIPVQQDGSLHSLSTIKGPFLQSKLSGSPRNLSIWKPKPDSQWDPLFWGFVFITFGFLQDSEWVHLKRSVPGLKTYCKAGVTSGEWTRSLFVLEEHLFSWWIIVR